eukprot:4315537-Prymnesium_polylepis.1
MHATRAVRLEGHGNLKNREQQTKQRSLMHRSRGCAADVHRSLVGVTAARPAGGAAPFAAAHAGGRPESTST